MVEHWRQNDYESRGIILEAGGPSPPKEEEKEKKKREKRKKGTKNNVKLLHIKCCFFPIFQ